MTRKTTRWVSLAVLVVAARHDHDDVRRGLPQADLLAYHAAHDVGDTLERIDGRG
jgi:hypothetical protein